MLSIEKYKNRLLELDPIRLIGHVTQVIGLTIESVGPMTKIGDICYVYPKDKETYIRAEVVGFRNEKTILMPLEELGAIGPGSKVISTGKPLQLLIGDELIGNVLDAFGKSLKERSFSNRVHPYSVEQKPLNPLERPRISQPLSVGIKTIDSLLTIGMGQRVGIFAGSGVGKSTLLGMIARNSTADVNVIALIGERGREVLEFIEKNLGEVGIKKSIIIVATSDQPAMLRIKGAYTATRIAEYFRDKGLNVMLMMDSITRFAMAQREVGLAIGEPPTTKGYTPSVFANLPRLLERSGTSRNGTITAFYTVLVDNDDFNEPISDTVRGILDGHIILSRKIANKGFYPAIDVMASISRVMNDIVGEEHLQMAEKVKSLLATYNEAEDLINIGAYKKGTNAKIDEAITLLPKIERFLKQSEFENFTFDNTFLELRNIFKG